MEEEKISTNRTSVGEVKQQLLRERMEKGRSDKKETKIYFTKASSTHYPKTPKCMSKIKKSMKERIKEINAEVITRANYG